MKRKFTRRNLRKISREEEAELVKAIIEIAYIIYNSGIIVGEKLEMPDNILFDIRIISSRASGYANREKFFTRNLEEISADEKKKLLNAIKKIAKITKISKKNIIKKLEIPKKLKM